jgi:hypothetical protein
MFAPVGEVAVNPGGEPERDETGLPPVDIEIPDDARELDRDVQAYYREQRAVRRQQRGLRLRGSLAKDGIVLPLLACCLILALITGTLLTVFTATSDQNLTGVPGSGKSTARPATGGAASGSAGRAASASASPSGGSPSSASPAAGSPPAGAATVPDTEPGIVPSRATIAVDGQPPIQVRNLTRAMLVLIPAHCDCGATISWLTTVATGAHAQTYLVYTASTAAEVGRLYQQLASGVQAHAILALESDNVLRDSVLGSQPANGLTAILLGLKGSAYYATGLSPRDDPTTLIRALTH